MSLATKVIRTVLFSAGLMFTVSTAQARFLSIDPVQFDEKNPASFNRYAYTNNNPINMIDPDGQEAWLISRPVGDTGLNHMFVGVKDDNTGVLTQFSYGPQGTPIINPGKLVNLNAYDTGADDADALSSFLADPSAAAANGIVAELINASDPSVIASGNAVNAVLGTRDNPASSAPNYDIFPSTHDLSNPSGSAGMSTTANSNSAAYAVANRANPSSTQAVPNKGKNPGQRQHRNVPRTGTRIKDRN